MFVHPFTCLCLFACLLFSLFLSLRLSFFLSFSLLFSLFLIPDDFSLFICTCKTEYIIRCMFDCVQNSRSRCTQPYRLSTFYRLRSTVPMDTSRLRRTISPPLRAKEKHERGRLRFLSFSRSTTLSNAPTFSPGTSLFLPPRR